MVGRGERHSLWSGTLAVVPRWAANEDADGNGRLTRTDRWRRATVALAMDLGLLRTRLTVALEHHGEVELAVMFGSRTRGEARPNSDVDVAVIGHAIDAIGLAVELTDAIGLPVDIVDLSVDP